MNESLRNIITEEIDAADKILNSDGTINFNSFSTKDELNPVIFNEDNTLKEGFLDTLLGIYHKIMSGLEFLTESEVEDVVVVGSLMSYHYSSYSDVDLHIMVDMEKINEDVDMVKRLLDDERKIWNREHDIEAEGYDVELYFQDVNEENASNGVYSILDDEWVKFPEKENTVLDKDTIERKALDYIEEIDSFETDKDVDRKHVEKLWDKIVNGRRESIKAEGEFSNDNIIFKILRRTEHLKKLKDIMDELQDEDYAENEEKNIEENMKKSINVKEFDGIVSESVKRYCEINGTKTIKRSDLNELVNAVYESMIVNEDDVNEDDIEECGDIANECGAPAPKNEEDMISEIVSKNGRRVTVCRDSEITEEEVRQIIKIIKPSDEDLKKLNDKQKQILKEQMLDKLSKIKELVAACYTI